MFIRLIAIVTIYILCVFNVTGSQSNECYNSIKYVNYNQSDPPPLVVSSLVGQAIDENKTPIPEVCLGLFTEKEHTLVATSVTDLQGNYQFNSIPPGSYRLIANCKAFCTANIPMQVIRKHISKRTKQRHIIIHMVISRIDACSFGDYK